MHCSLRKGDGRHRWEKDASVSSTKGQSTRLNCHKHEGEVPNTKPPLRFCSTWLPFLIHSAPEKLSPFLLPGLEALSCSSIWQHKPGDGREPNVHGTHTDELPAPSWAPSVPSEPAITDLQPHSEAPVRQQVDAPLHHVPGQLSVAWHWSFSFCVRVVLCLSKGNLIWKTKPFLKS